MLTPGLVHPGKVVQAARVDGVGLSERRFENIARFQEQRLRLRIISRARIERAQVVQDAAYPGCLTPRAFLRIASASR